MVCQYYTQTLLVKGIEQRLKVDRWYVELVGKTMSEVDVTTITENKAALKRLHGGYQSGLVWCTTHILAQSRTRRLAAWRRTNSSKKD